MLDEDRRYHIRDSKPAPHGPVIIVSRAEWDDLCTAASQAGSTSLGTVHVTVDPGRSFRIEQRATSSTLDFTAPEHECFVDGVQNGEFTAGALTAA
jgi:hypothetical protein